MENLTNQKQKTIPVQNSNEHLTNPKQNKIPVQNQNERPILAQNSKEQTCDEFKMITHFKLKDKRTRLIQESLYNFDSRVKNYKTPTPSLTHISVSKTDVFKPDFIPKPNFDFTPSDFPQLIATNPTKTIWHIPVVRNKNKHIYQKPQPMKFTPFTVPFIPFKLKTHKPSKKVDFTVPRSNNERKIYHYAKPQALIENILTSAVSAGHTMRNGLVNNFVNRDSVVRAFNNSFVDPIVSVVTSSIDCITAKIVDIIKLTMGNALIIGDLYISFSDLISSMIGRYQSVITNVFVKFDAIDNFKLRLILFVKKFWDVLEKIFKYFNISFSTTDLRALAQDGYGATESLISAALLSAALPDKFKKLFKDIPIFTSKKILDSTSWLYDILEFIIKIPRGFINLLPDIFFTKINITRPELLQYLTDFEDKFPLCSHGKILASIDSMNMMYEKDNRVILSDIWINKFDQVVIAFNNWSRNYESVSSHVPPYMVTPVTKFKDLMKRVKEHYELSRVEPVAIALVGPPGCGKTVAASDVVESAKSVESTFNYLDVDGKQFMDAYESQGIFLFDDIGQQVGQWAPVINMVSGAPMPLNVARVEKKGTKKFVSKLILLTTNGIPIASDPKEGIKDIKALWRRLHKFDFTKCIFNTATQMHEGSVSVNKFNVKTNMWETTHMLYFDCDNFQELDDNLYTTTQTVKINIHPKDFSSFIWNYSRKNYEINTKFYNDIRDRQRAQEFKPFASPQALPDSDIVEETTRFTMLSTMQTLGEMFKSVITHYSNLLSSDTVMDAMLTGVKGTLIGIAGMGVFYVSRMIINAIRDYLDDDKHYVISKDVTNVQKHYRSARTDKITIQQALPQSFEELFLLKNDYVQPQLNRFKDNLKMTEIFYNESGTGKQRHTFTIGLYSGGIIIVPAHCIKFRGIENILFSTYRSKDNLIYESMEAEMIHFDAIEDWVMFRMAKGSPKHFRKLNINEPKSKELFMVVPDGIYNLQDKIKQSDINTSYINVSTDFESTINANTNMFYDMEMDGMCGSLLMTKDGGLIGQHVAAAYADGKTYGVSRILSVRTKELWQHMFDKSGDSNTIVENKIRRDFSGAHLLFEGKGDYPNLETKYVKSPIHGIAPLDKMPADLKKYGNDTIEVASAALFKPQSETNRKIDFEVLTKATNYVDGLVRSDYVPTPMTEYEIIKGDQYLNRIDPNTSSGFKEKLTKREILNYEDGTIDPEYKIKFGKICDRLLNDEIPEELYYKNCLKDELLKVGKDPRVFSAGPIFLTLLYRFFFGKFLGFTMKNKYENGIMIGINPLGDDWSRIAKDFSQFSPNGISDLDYSKFDKNMVSVFQRYLAKIYKRSACTKASDFNSVFGTNYNDKQISDILDICMENIISTYVISRSKLTLTTHGNPSGCALTAHYNSCMNAMYISYAFIKLHPEIPTTCLPACYKAAFYGDDVLLAVKELYKSSFSGLQINGVLSEIGLGVTPGNKGSWEDATPFSTIDDVTFLKREFRFHRKLFSVVGPLNLTSLWSSLNYVTDGLRDVDLIIDKVKGFQRELFLHEDKYEQGMELVKEHCAKKGITVPLLSTNELCRLYNTDAYAEHLFT